MAISIHPRNPKLFQFRGRPLVLICATEHYGAVLNRPFRFEPYLTNAADRGQTLTRLFTPLPRTPVRSQSLLDLQARIDRLHRSLCAHWAGQGPRRRAALRSRDLEPRVFSTPPRLPIQGVRSRRPSSRWSCSPIPMPTTCGRSIHSTRLIISRWMRRSRSLGINT